MKRLAAALSSFDVGAVDDEDASLDSLFDVEASCTFFKYFLTRSNSFFIG